MAKGIRLDQALVQRGFFPSRHQAQSAIMAGEIRINGRVAEKASDLVMAEHEIQIAARSRYVGRGGLKLEGAIAHFQIVCEGGVGLDIGASTGGFTDCLLQHGAKKVFAVDVGHGQLAWKIRDDSRVITLEKTNARNLSRAEIPEPIDICAVDVSFISLTLILPPALALLSNGGVIIPLIKPQFELRKEDVGKGGVVRDPALHEQAVEKIRAFVATLPSLAWSGLIESPILGGEGNKEFLACLRVASV